MRRVYMLCVALGAMAGLLIMQAQEKLNPNFTGGTVTKLDEGTKAAIEYDKKENKLTLHADNKGQLDTVIQMLKEKMAKRGISVKAIKRGKMEEATHESVREVITLHVGIETDDAKKIVKQIKGMGIKVQSQIMDSKVRVTGKKLDELQSVIAFLKENGPEYPLQFVNFT